jgi:hypothetical protein
MKSESPLVPSAGCTACCRDGVLVLELDSGDDVSSYEHEAVLHPITGEPAIALKRSPPADRPL